MEIKYTKSGIIVGDVFTPIEEILSKIAQQKIEDDVVLLTMSIKEERGFDGCLEQIVLPKENAEEIVEYMQGKLINFGEIAGKHSEVFCYFSENNYNISSDKGKIRDFLVEHRSGYYSNHSFLDIFVDSAFDGRYYGMLEEDVRDFCKLYEV